MPTPHQLLFELGIPAGIVIVLGFIVSLVTRGNSSGVILGLGAGLVQCFHVLNGVWPEVRGREADTRITLSVAGLAIILAAVSPAKVPAIVRWILFILTPAAALWFVFSALPPISMPRDLMWQGIALVGGVAAVIIVLVELLSRSTGAASAALVLGPWCAGAAVMLLLCGNQKLGWMSAALAVMLLGAFIIALVALPEIMSSGPVALVVTATAALIAYGFYDPGVMTRTELALLAGAPLVAMLGQLPPIGRAKPWKREVMRLLLMFVPLGIAIGLAYIQFKKDSGDGM